MMKDSSIKIGVHCSIRKGYKHVFDETKFLGCNCLQMFTHSPRVWKFLFPKEDEINEFKILKNKYNFYPLVVHTAYLPNPASSNKDIYLKSKKLLLLEFELAKKFNVDYIVMHPGSYSEGKTLKEGIKNLLSAIDYCFDYIYKNYKMIDFMLLLENVCGSGRKIGKTFDEIAEIIYSSNYKRYIGLCLDTAHSFAYGYNIATIDGIEETLSNIDKNIGLNKLKIVHLNDSQSDLGSKIDKHYHIGKGKIGLEGFKILLKRLKNYPLILETPKETSFGEISNKDKENVQLVKRLISF